MKTGKKVYCNGRRLYVVEADNKNWRLVDSKGNAYDYGTPTQISKRIDKLVKDGTFICK